MDQAALAITVGHERRITVLERPYNLQQHNCEKVARAASIREAVRKVLETSTHPFDLTSKHVRRRLDLVALDCTEISDRSLREHMHSIRGRAPVPPK